MSLPRYRVFRDPAFGARQYLAYDRRAGGYRWGPRPTAFAIEDEAAEAVLALGYGGVFTIERIPDERVAS